MKAHDIHGILIGVPLFLLGLFALALGWEGVVLLVLSLGLLLPSSLYENGRARPFGFVALPLAATVTAYCAVVLGWLAFALVSDPPEDDMSWVMIAVAMFWYLIALALGASGIWVLLKKLRPRPAQAAIGVTAGIVAGVFLASVV